MIMRDMFIIMMFSAICAYVATLILNWGHIGFDLVSY